jgi:hypothetical protein
MISEMLLQISSMKQADEDKIARLEERFTAAMALIEAFREWTVHPNNINVAAIHAAELRLDDILKS